MKQDQFEALVKRLEVYAQQKPENYKMRVRLLAILCYAYIFFILVVLIAATLGTIILIYISFSRFSHNNPALIKLCIFLIIAIFITLRSLFIRIPVPQGLRLHRKEVPHLFALIDQLQNTFSSIPIHHIILSYDCNASVAQIPLFGFFGWTQNYLIIGLPLLQILSPEQFKATLAHEFGHLSRNHCRFSAWIYRVRQIIAQIFQGIQNTEDYTEHTSSVDSLYSMNPYILFEDFFKWYYPLFNAYSFVLARNNEYEADHCASELVGNQHIAEALINIQVQSAFLEKKFWHDIYEKVKEQPEPPIKPFNDLANTICQIDSSVQQEYLNQALACHTNYSDTHPCLSDRLTALGYCCNSKSLPLPITKNAAQCYLGEAITLFLKETLNILWRIKVNFYWHECYNYLQKIKQDLAEIEQKIATTHLTIDESWYRAWWTLELKGDQAAIPLLQEVLNLQNDHASANYILGKILISQNDVHGIKNLELAMNKDIKIVIECCQIISDFLRKKGQIEQANQYIEQSENHQKNLLAAKKERSVVYFVNKFEPDDLSLEEQQKIRDKLASYPQIQVAYLVKKVVKFFPENPFYVLLIKRRNSWWKLDLDFFLDHNYKLLKRLEEELKFLDSLWIIVSTQTFPNDSLLERKIRKAAREKIYQKTKK